jgi:hypothetical protein
MKRNSVEAYAEFLAECRKVMGPFDLEKLAYDQNYKTEFFNRVVLSADDHLFQMAAMVNNQLNEEMASAR